MPKIVEIPGLGNVEFPDSMSDAQINSAIETDILPKIGQGSAPTGRGGVLPSLAEGFATSFTGIPLGIAGLYSATPEETALGRFSTGAEKVVQDILGIDPTKEATTAEAVAGGLGSLASFLVPGTLAAKGVRAAGAGAQAARAAGYVAAGAQAVPLGTAEQVQRRMAEEASTGVMTPEQDRLGSQLLGGAIGITELVPLRRFMGPLEAILARVPIAKAGGVAKTVELGVKRALGAATEEGAQEALAQTAQNLVEQGYYNPDLDVTEGLLSSAGVGGAAGGTLDVILQLMAGRKASKMRTAFTQLERENARQAAEKAPERIRADALAGREQLLRNAPSGEISITSADNTETGFKYKVVDASGKAAATFDTKDAAFLAAEQYERDNPGAVTFIRPTIAEAARTTKGKPTKQEKKQGKKIAQELKAEGVLQPAPAQLPTTPAGQATTGAAIAETVQQVGATPTQAAEIVNPAAPKKGRKKRIAPVEAPVEAPAGAVIPEGIAAPPPVSTTAAGIPAPPTAAPVAMEFGTADERAAIRREIAPQAETFRDMTPEQQAAYNAELDRRYPGRSYSVFPAPTAPQATPTAAPVSPTEAPPAAVQAQPAPKPPREFKPSVRALFKPVVTSPDGMRKLQEFEAKRDEVSKALNTRLAPIVGSQARVQLVDVVRQGKGIAEGEVLPAGDVIYLSYNLYDPNLTTDQMVDKLFDVINHEVIHSLSNLGLFRGNELPTLFKAAERIKYQGNQFTYYDRAVRMYATVQGYRNPDGSLNEEMIHEEAVAEMFRDARAGKLKLEGTPKGVFGRIVEFFKRLFNGYRDAKVGQIFKDIEAGKMGAREARAVEGGVRKLSALPEDDSTKIKLAQEADNAFTELAGAQRGEPELYMVFAQNALRDYKSGPALTYAMEHVGDLTHRMAQYGNKYPSYEFGIEFVVPKVRTGLSVVTNRVDAERIAKLPDDPTLKKYADAHSKLKVYNEAQRAARDAAVALGRKDLKEAERNLLILQEMIDNGTYVEIAGSYDPQFEGGVRKLSALPEDEKTKLRLARREETLAKAKQVVDSFYEEFPPHPFMKNTLAFRVDDSEGFVALELEPEVYVEPGEKAEGVVHVKWLQAYPMRSGLGRKGMELIQERAREAGVPITLEPFEKGVVGLAGLNKFYKKMGFKPRVKGDNRHLIWRPEEQAEGGVRKFSILAKDVEEVRAALDAADARLSGTAADAITRFVGYEPQSREGNLQGLIGIMKAEGLERIARGEDPQAAAELEAAFAPARAFLRKKFGDTIKLYRRQNVVDPNAPVPVGFPDKERAVLSWTADESVAKRFAGVSGRIPERITEEDILKAERDLANTGEARFPRGKTREYLRKRPESKYIDIYDDSVGGHVTDIESVRRFADDHNAIVDEYDAERSEKLKRMATTEVPIDDILFATDRVGQMEFMVLNRGEKYFDKTGQRKFSIPAQLTGESEQEFARWWKQSKAVDSNGMPQVFYHGRPRPLREGQFNRGASGALPGEEGPYFFSTSKRFAEDYALFDRSKFSSNIESETGVMYPVYLSVQNPFDYESASDMRNLAAEIKRLRPDGLSMVDMFGKNGETMLDTPKERASESFRFFENLDRGSWRQMENPIVQRAIRNLGYDGFYLRENAYKNLAVYKPEQIKSIYNQFEPGTAESRKLSVIPPYPDDTTSTVYIREAGPAARLKPSGKVTVGEIAKAFDAITGKSDITDPADYNRIVNAIVDEVEYQKRQAQSGVGWYDNDVDLVFKILSETFPQFSDPFYGAQNRQLFTIIAGVMSNGMKARPNVTMAAINFANYMNTGKFSEIHPFTGKGWNQRTNIMSGQIRMLNSMMADPMFNVPAGSNMTREERFLEWIFSEHPVREINQMRARHGVKSPAKIGGVDTMRLGAYAFGPKFGPFILNLNGRTDETVDSWASRSFYRHMGRLLAKNGKKTNDAPITGADREAMKRALRDIADKTNLSSRDVQAVLWFYEKALYNDLGMKIPLEVFSDGARDYVNQFGKGKANDPTADDRTRAIARAGEAAGTRTTAPTPGGVAESEAVAQELKIANEIAENAAKTGEASQAEADVANQAVRDAVRKLSTIPQPVPMPPEMEDANRRIFAATHVPSTIGEKIMGVLGGISSREGIGRRADMFRVYYVQKTGQITKMERQAYLTGAPNPDEAEFAEYSATGAADMMQRSSHYTVEAAYHGAPVIRSLNAKREAVSIGEGGDPNSAYMYIEKDQADSPLKVLEKIITGGPNGGDLTEQFRSYAIAQVSKRRLAEGKDIPEDVTPEYIEAADALAEQYPIIKEAFESYQRFNTKLLEAVRDSGYLSQELFEEFTDQQNYYSMYRQLEEGDVVQELSGGLASRIRFKAYEGSTTGNLMADPIVAMMHNVAFWNNVILRTLATQKAFRVGEATGVVKRLRAFEDEEGNVTIETPSRADGFDDKTFYTYINGIEIPFASKDPLFTIGLSGNDFASPGLFLESAGIPANFLREMVTRDPGFMIANLMRDSVSTWVLAGSGANPFQTFKGFISALNSSSSFEALRSYGVVGSFDEAQKPMAKIVAGMRQKLTKVQGLPDMTSALRGAWNKLGSWSEASDAATRIAVYEAAKRDGATDFTAAYRALSIMNFSRSGHSAGLRMWTRMVPFLNARIQGFDVLYTGLKAATGVLTGRDQLDFERQRGTHVLVRGMALTAAAMALSLLLEDDEDYQELPPYIKDANILIPIPGQKGQYFQIPKPFEAGFLFMTVPQAFYDVAMGNRSMRSATKLMFNQFSSTFGFNPIPQAALPIVENMINRDFYTGQPLISTGMQQLDPSLQYSPSTSYVARGLSQLSSFLPLNYNFEEGRFVPISPIMLDNLITGYGGPIVSYIAMAAGGMTYAFGSDNQGLPVAGSQLPVIRRFFVDARDRQPQAATEAYELYQLVDKTNRTISRLKKMGDTEALREYREENINILRVGKEVRRMADNLNNIRAQIRRLEADKVTPMSEKLDKLRELRSRELRVTRRIDEINQKLGR